ncbi:T9SS type A sorting domain-containing protein [Brumimicrobium glaciale]|uniref:T9SS type A sorting domain-containing protein n=1 Tax=Brumimicrobium glaciale TaxID=200475 RepID=A0A4Q4KPG5_9FLAO|nr:choice-of-anchor L domain-containing protein [Brumimicrobium glaciale]RYM34910.1 T9SS type A sorting domain-containing protein [Brumimicrobium glaciale]
MKTILAILFSLNLLIINAQLTTNNSLSPNFLAQSILSGYGVNVSNVSYTGNVSSMGLFNGANTVLEIQYGLIMTTGTAGYSENGPHGPNDQSNAGVDNGALGNALLTQLAGVETYNASLLEFDLVANSDTLKLDYIFGSDEYPEFVGTSFNGVFGIFISGPGIVGGIQNIATVPNTSQPININTINQLTNPIFYNNNGNGTEAPFNQDDQFIQYDGFTTKLTAYSQIIPGETYHLIIGIADVGDGIYDTGVFIEASSLSTRLTESQKIKHVNLYPNPNKGVFSIEKPSENDVENLKVISSLGREVSFKIEKNNDSQIRIKLEKANPGVYWINFNSKNGDFYSSKFVVE